MGIFSKIFKSKCSCGNCSTEEISKENTLKKETDLNIKILGIGCKNCTNLSDNVKEALITLNIEADIEKITNLAEISSYGIMSTPGLVINEKIVSYGKVLKTEDIIKILEKYKENI
ncbi:thioredoxin family protein [Fusobacterium varium]|uniref:thioredoxin family protein n=1 Tax=Fusobacterium varium TaxID=856 RepID=UPI003562021B